MMINNVGLVNHAKKALYEKWGYVWGTFGQVLTEKLLEQKIKQYPKGVGDRAGFIRDNYIGRRTADCVGLIKSYMWWNDNDVKYDPKSDLSADMMYNSAIVKGNINTITEIPGVCLWKKGHIGIYIGNGEVIEAHSTTAGVIKTPLRGQGSTNWTHWLQCPYIVYPDKDDIIALQTNLNKFGYDLVVDGIFGPLSFRALKHFQESNNLIPDGMLKDEDIRIMDELISRLEGSKKKNYIQLIQENSDGHIEEWVRGINLAVKVAELDGNLGDLEIFKFLPQLIEKIGNK